MTVIWLLVWAIAGTQPVIFENVATAPHLNAWAIALVIAVALDLGGGAAT